jgi:L-fuconolactonase
MAAPIERIVDAHVHLWDPARADWYPYLAGQQQLDMGDTSGMARHFDQDTYFEESKRWPIEKFVHIAAANSRFSIEETLELDEQARSTGHPDAIIGGFLPGLPIGESIALLEAHLRSPRFRGIRVMGGSTGTVPEPDVLGALRDRDLVLDLMAHTDELLDAVAALAAGPEVTVVVEHAGWPRGDSPAEFSLWQKGMAALASLGERVSCKVSGLAMPLGSMDVAAFEPWVSYCLEVFGSSRCMFASNFPVDGMHGSFDELYSLYDALTADAGVDERRDLFAGTAERVYRC